MIKSSELREILYANKIKGYSHYTKKQLIEFLEERGMMPKEKPKPEKPKKEIDPKYARLATIKNNPRRVTLKDIETEEELEFPSIYKAAQFLKRNPNLILFWNGRVWNNLYEIKIMD